MADACARQCGRRTIGADALAVCRAALSDGNLAEARRALEEARRAVYFLEQAVAAKEKDANAHPRAERGA